MWTKLSFEKKMEDALKRDLGEADGEKYFARYTEARNYLAANVYEEIKGKVPQMSDHGPRHIANVLNNADLLLTNNYDRLNGINLYCLGMIILFHDVGNIDGRSGHNKRIAQVYNEVRNNKPEFSQERICVIRAAEAHTGFSAKDSSTDTLKDVAEVDHIDGKKIHLRELAAILRLADECAEGHQRTSDDLNKTGAYDSSSELYHMYAQITNVLIDPGGERIVLTYNIDVKSETIDNGWLDKILEFVMKRILKLDIERRYCKHYSQLMFSFKKTEATINFTIDGILCDFSISNIILADRFPKPTKDEDLDLSEIKMSGNPLDISKIVEQLKAIADA